uniref:NADH-ubiquinone oxidoreductase chain 6 n=1 Tax=Diabrotica virgifera virgifera TaxID=50390 RepID=V5KVB5_DIAVI|nr:NADH dehydrogenase subunit 6 [Diabrotica virgifera virgifera]
MSDILTLIIMMIMCSIMFMLLNHPLTCGLMLLMQTIFTSVITGLMNYNYWFSYILFLIMVGGMLILFIYMTSIASNEKFKFNFNMTLMMISIFIIISMLSFILDYFYFNSFMKIMEMNNQFNIINNKLSLIKYFNFPNNLIMMMMIIYLFITLIAVVKITKFLYGPLRQKF